MVKTELDCILFYFRKHVNQTSVFFLLMTPWIGSRSPPSLHIVHLFLSFFSASQALFWNTKKKKLQSNFLFKAFSLAEIQYKKIFSAVNLLGVITNNAPRVHFFTVLGYMCLSFTSVNLSHRNLPYRTTSGFPCVVKKTSLLYIQTPPAFWGWTRHFHLRAAWTLFS